MSILPVEPTSEFVERDFLIAYRERIWSLFGMVFMAVFLPGAIFLFITGHWVTGSAVVLTAGVFALNRYTALRDKAPNVMMAAFVGALMLAIGLSLLDRGMGGALWAFPGILLINFISTRRPARIFTAIFMVYVSGLLFYTLDPQLAVRAVIALIVTALLTHIFLGIIDTLHSKLVDLSIMDPMTGALNRRQIDPILEEAIERKRRSNTPASLLVLDVDNFKSVNDNYGHAVGDHVLIELVKLLKRRARRLDKLFRMGGEEFVLFLPDTDAKGAASLAEDVRLAVEKADLIEGRVVTISIGIGEIEHGESIDEWIKRGDDALFEAKNNGRNQTVGARVPALTSGPDPAKFQPYAMSRSVIEN